MLTVCSTGRAALALFVRRLGSDPPLPVVAIVRGLGACTSAVVSTLEAVDDALLLITMGVWLAFAGAAVFPVVAGAGCEVFPELDGGKAGTESSVSEVDGPWSVEVVLGEAGCVAGPEEVAVGCGTACTPDFGAVLEAVGCVAVEDTAGVAAT